MFVRFPSKGTFVCGCGAEESASASGAEGRGFETYASKTSGRRNPRQPHFFFVLFVSLIKSSSLALWNVVTTEIGGCEKGFKKKMPRAVSHRWID